MIAHILYVFTLILFLILFIFFVKKNRQISNGSEPKENIRKYDLMFKGYSFLLTLANVMIYAYVLKKNNYQDTCFIWCSGPLISLLSFYLDGIDFISTKFRYDRHEDKKTDTHPKSLYTVYTAFYLEISSVLSIIPSYIIFGIIRPEMDIDAIAEIPMVLIISLIGAYQIILALYRIFQKEKKDVSYISFIISVILIFVSSYCYSILLEYWFFPVVGIYGPSTTSTFTVLIIFVLTVITSKKQKKTYYEGKTQLTIKNGFRFFQIINIVQGIILPLAAVFFYVLNHFNLITI